MRRDKARPEPRARDAYLDEEREVVDGREAAQILGVSDGRWRQLTGTRADPKSPLGAGIIEEGTRGARWPLRAVLEYALSQDRKITTPIPPLLPHPAERQRYESVRGRSYGAAPAAEIRIEQRGDRPVVVRGELFVPRGYDQAGTEVGSVLLVTPLWPTPDYAVTTRPVALRLAREAMMQPGWAEITRGTPALTLVALPVGSEHSFHHSPWVEVVEFDEPVLEALTSASVEQLDEVQLSVHDVGYKAPATDVAACLGMPALPWWPEGTATASTCSRWATGQPVTLSHPPAAADRWQAKQWLLHHLHNDLWGAEGITHVELLSLAESVDPARWEAGLTHKWEPDLPAGFEVAAKLLPAEELDVPRGVSWFQALDVIARNAAIPLRVGRALLDYFGDPAFRGPATLPLETFPPEWTASLRTAARPNTTPGARWDRVKTAHTARTTSVGATPIMLGPLSAPAYVDDTCVTWLAPTGWDPENDEDCPGRAIPGGIMEAWFAPAAHRDDRVVLGWARTVDDEMVPLPANPPGPPGTVGTTLRALANGLPTRDQMRNDFGARPYQDELTRHLAAVREQAVPPAPVPWPDLLEMARG